MADAPIPAPTAPPLTDDGLVRAYSPAGDKIRVKPEDVDRLTQAGGRLASQEELATIRLDKMDAEKAARRRDMSVGDLLRDVGGEAVGRLGTQVGGFIGGGGIVGGTVGALAGSNRSIEAFGEGANEAATLGLSKLAAKGVASALGGPEAVAQEQERRALLEQAHGGAKGLGTAGGIITQSIATAGIGPGSGAARFLNPIGIAGDAAEHGVARALAGLATKGALGRATATAANLGARGAVESALQEGADEVTDAMFADRELAGEKVLAAMGHGAIFGGLAGAGLGFGGSLAASAARGGANKLGQGLQKLRGRSAAADELADDAASVARLTNEAADVVEASKVPGASRAEQLMSRESAEAAARSLGGTRKNVDKITRELGDGGVEKLGKFVQENYLAPAAKEQGLVRGIMDSTPEALLPKIQSDLQTTGSAIGRTLRDSGSSVEFTRIKKGLAELGEAARKEGAAGVEAAKRMERVVGNFDEALRARGLVVDVPANAAEHAAASKAATEAQAHMTQLEARIEARSGSVPEAPGQAIERSALMRDYEAARKANNEAQARLVAAGPAPAAGAGMIPVADLHELRRDLATLAYGAKARGESKAVDVLKSWERDIQTSVMDALPEAQRGELKTLNERYRMLKLAEEVAETGVERAKGNNRIGLRDTIMAGGALATGNVLAAAGTLVGSKLVNRYGDAAAAILLQRASESGSVIRAVQRIDSAVSRAAKGVVDGTAKASKVSRAASPAVDPRPRARQAIARITAAQTDPIAYGDRVRKTTSPLKNAPEVSSAVESGAVRALDFLARKMPRQFAEPDPLRPERDAPLSKQDAAKVLRYVDALKDPTTTFDSIAAGRVNREQIEVLKDVYPKLYGQLQQQTLDRVQALAAKGTPLPYATRVRIGTVLGVPMDPSMRPDMMRALQANVMPVESKQEGAPSGAPPQSPRRPLSTNTKTQQAGLDAVE